MSGYSRANVGSDLRRGVIGSRARSSPLRSLNLTVFREVRHGGFRNTPPKGRQSPGVDNIRNAGPQLIRPIEPEPVSA